MTTVTLTGDDLPQSTFTSIRLPALPFTLDCSCPINLPSRRNTSLSEWPFAIAGSVPDPSESLEDYISRRYYETLYMGDILFPISSFVVDIERTLVAHQDLVPGILAGRIRPLADVEKRHRRSLMPVVAAALTAEASTLNDTSASSARKSLDEAIVKAELSPTESELLRICVELRSRSRAIVDAERSISPRIISEELQRREILIQLVLLLLYRPHHVKAEDSTKPERKKRRRRDDSTVPSPTDDLPAALELLVDRIGVWQAVADLDITGPALDPAAPAASTNADKAPKRRDKNSITYILRQFWETVMVARFIKRDPSACSSFHLKVFGTAMPAELAPQRKPRKPKVTQRLGSEDTIGKSLQPPTKLRMSDPTSTTTLRQTSPSSTRGESFSNGMRRSSSRMSSHHGSPPSEEARGLRRSASRASMITNTERELDRDSSLKRARSSSVDYAGRDMREVSAGAGISRTTSKSHIVRAPSGKDLFKGREVGLLRRSNSLMLKASSTSKHESQSQDRGSNSLGLLGSRGLLGRRTESLTESMALSNTGPSAGLSRSQSEAGTLIFATPAKKSGVHSMFAPRESLGHGTRLFCHPTPIREEPSSAETNGRSYVTETPVASRHRGNGGSGGHQGQWSHDNNPFMTESISGGSKGTRRVGTDVGVAETPMAPSRVAPHGVSFGAQLLRDIGDHDDDGEDGWDSLMVPTDDEGDEDEDGPAYSPPLRSLDVVRETPRKGN